MPLQDQIKCKLNIFRFTLCAMFAENMNSTEQNEFLVWHPHSGYHQTLNFPTSAQRYVYFLAPILIPLSLQKVWFGTGNFHSTGKDTIFECIFNVFLWCQAVVDSNSYKLMSFVTTSRWDCSGCCSFQVSFFFCLWCHVKNQFSLGIFSYFFISCPPSLSFSFKHPLVHFGSKIFISSSWDGCWPGDNGFANISARSVAPLLHMQQTAIVMFFVCSQFKTSFLTWDKVIEDGICPIVLPHHHSKSAHAFCHFGCLLWNTECDVAQQHRGHQWLLRHSLGSFLKSQKISRTAPEVLFGRKYTLMVPPSSLQGTISRTLYRQKAKLQSIKFFCLCKQEKKIGRIFHWKCWVLPAVSVKHGHPQLVVPVIFVTKTTIINTVAKLCEEMDNRKASLCS